jgi:HD-like signal output (HDOD) protein
MAARESAEVQAALVDHLAGMSQVDAAKKHGVNRSSIGRALLRHWALDAERAASLVAVASGPDPVEAGRWPLPPPT